MRLTHFRTSTKAGPPCGGAFILVRDWLIKSTCVGPDMELGSKSMRQEWLGDRWLGPLTRWAALLLVLRRGSGNLGTAGCLIEAETDTILIGLQRAGKSQLRRNLLPEQIPEWYADSVNVSEGVQN